MAPVKESVATAVAMNLTRYSTLDTLIVLLVRLPLVLALAVALEVRSFHHQQLHQYCLHDIIQTSVFTTIIFKNYDNIHRYQVAVLVHQTTAHLQVKRSMWELC